MEKEFEEKQDVEINIHKAFEIITNMVEVSKKHRLKLANQGYFQKLFTKMLKMSIITGKEESEDEISLSPTGSKN